MKSENQPLTEPQKFARDIAWVALSQVVVGLVGIITLPAITKSYGSEIYGVWSQILVTSQLLASLLTLQLGTSVVRYLAAQDDKEKLRQAFGTMLWAIIFFTCLLLAALLMVRRELALFLFTDPKYIIFVSLSFFWATTTAFFTFLLSYLRAKNRINELSIFQLFCSVIKIMLIFLFASSKSGLELIVASQIMTELFFIGLVLMIILKEIGIPPIGFKNLKKYLALSAPHILNVDFLWIINASDRYFITHFLNLSQTGIYSVASSLGSIISLFFSPIAFVLFPTVSKLWENRETKMVKNYLEYSTKLFLTFAIPGTAGLYSLAQPLLKSLATQEFIVSGEMVLLLALGIVFLGIYNINLYIIFLVQKTRWIPLIIGLSAVISIVVNITLIPHIGIMGAAISKIISFFVLAAIVTVWAQRTLGYKIDLHYLLKLILASLIMIFCLKFINADNILEIVFSIITGATIFISLLLLLKAFSKDDKKLIKETFLNPILGSIKK